MQFDINYRKKIKNENSPLSNTKLEGNPLFINEHFPQRIDEAEHFVRQLISTKYADKLLDATFKEDLVFVEELSDFINDSLTKKGYLFENTHARYRFINDFITQLTGFGILQPLMDDPAITEIYVLRWDNIFYTKRGKKIPSPIKFKNKEAVKNYIDAILAPLGRRVDNLNPMEDARLRTGDRVAISGDAISPQGFSFNIRKFSREKIVMQSLIDFRTINKTIAEMIKGFVDLGLNAVVAGGTGSGKTTFLNAMADFIKNDVMVATVEDNIELQLNKEMWLQLEARTANIEGKGEITLAQGLKHFLRRAPDIIIVGEVRDGVVGQTYLQAANTGHIAYATIHANSPVLCRQRFSNLVMGATGNPESAVVDDFNKAVKLIYHVERFSELNRIILMHITYVDDEGAMTHLAKYNPEMDEWTYPEELPESLKAHYHKQSFMRSQI